MQTKFTVIDLFAGCGGLSTGLEMAGFGPILFSELDQDARNTYIENRYTLVGDTPFKKCGSLHFGDVYDLSKKVINSAKTELKDRLDKIDFDRGSRWSPDLLCGGPPCQGFSGIGHRRSYSVDKSELPSNHLYEKMIEQIRYFSPKIFLFENVKGLMSARWSAYGKKGEIFEQILGAFKSIPGYHVFWSLLLAKDYGVPQNRPRLFVVGIREDLLPFVQVIKNGGDDAIFNGCLPEPDYEVVDLCDLLSDLEDPKIPQALREQNFWSPFRTNEYLKPPLNKTQEKLRTTPSGHVMAMGEPLAEQDYSRHKSRIVSKFDSMIASDGAIPDEFKTKKFAQRLLPKHWKNKGPFITTTSLPDDYVHYNQPRILTVREWARLQTFPDWYVFKGNRTTGGLRRAGNPKAGIFDREVPKYTQIGNAVPVLLAEKIGKHFAKLLDLYRENVG
ncbi:DNA cytosine methyltransferase [Alphaproteobacteria bacterium]|nr:DNA cytosine methyltransferase [Alphaproteobacteria bacterium]